MSAAWPRFPSKSGHLVILNHVTKVSGRSGEESASLEWKTIHPALLPLNTQKVDILNRIAQCLGEGVVKDLLP